MEEICNLRKNVHEHPLILYQYGKPPNGKEVIICCSKCGQPWQPPAFTCSSSNCNFHIHQSCIDLPSEIHTPIHHHNKSPLTLTLNPSNTYCKCCGQKPSGSTYNCLKCDFIMDIQCVIADTKASGLRHVANTGEFRYFAHPHPLTFSQHQQFGNRIVVCLVCNLRIKSDSSTYFSSHSDSYFHQQCVELSREILDFRYHKHPLFLFARFYEKNILCNSCRNHCFTFFYSCPLCKFSLHVSCLTSFQHRHEFIKLLKVFPYTCQICGKNLEPSIPWFCSICHLFAHKKCAELPTILHTYEHRHPLNLTFSHPDNNLTDTNIVVICKICGENINTSFARYACDHHNCSYDAHLDCAKYQEQYTKSIVSTKAYEMKEIFPHFSHEHKLILCRSEEEDMNKHCNGCMQCIISECCYGCQQCEFYLHEECATFPKRHRNFSLHSSSHELKMVYIPDFIFSCAVCLQYCHGFAYHCVKCNYTIDIRCATITFPFTHPSHNHPLFPCNDKGKHKCGGCAEGVKNKLVFGCEDCEFYLDARCANLPVAVRNRFDEHPLSLTFVNELDGNECYYYCDICEEERATNEWFYCCKMCDFAAHLSCAIGDYPFLKSAKFEGHKHVLNLVKEGKKGYSVCGACGHSCEGNLAFECEHCTCKFNVHASGLCCHDQLTQARITFVMPSLYSRSLPLRIDSIQRTRSKNISLGRDGNRSRMNERGIDSTQIQYEKNEKSFWFTNHGGDEGSTSKTREDEKDVEWKVAMPLEEYNNFGGEYWDDGAFPSIHELMITHENSINSIRIKYDVNGTSTWLQKHGGIRGATSTTVKLKYPDEFLISIRGYTGYDGKFYVVRSLSLESNKNIYGPFGKEEGKVFWLPTIGAKIVGFHGRSGTYLNSIGIKVVPIHNNLKITTLEG